jgi:hypothetical protein
MELVVLGTAAAAPFLALVHLLPFFLPCCLGVHDDGALQEPPEDVETANETEEKTEEEVPEAEGESEQAGRLIAKRRQGFCFVYGVVTGKMGGWLPVYH